MDPKDSLKKTRINQNIVKSHNYLSRMLMGKNSDGSLKYKYVYDKVGMKPANNKKK